MKRSQLFILMCALALVATTSADELIMKNGSRLVGTLIKSESGKVEFETPFAGKLTINQENIDHIVTENPVTVQMADGSVILDKQIVSNESDGQMMITSDTGQTVNYGISEIAIVNPAPWQLGNGYNWTGELSAALESERGNSDSDELDYELKSTWRSLADRYVIRSEGELDNNNGDKTNDNWEIRSKYDRFLKSDPDDYWGVKLRFEYDKFADLDLRTIFGPHLGRQFFETPMLTLSAELGPVWVDEQFDVAEDNDFPGALWEVEATSDIIGFGTTLYAIHDGIYNFDASDEIILNTRIGIKMPLIFGLHTAIEAKYEYDGGAVEGVDDTDETYNFRIGYSW